MKQIIHILYMAAMLFTIAACSDDMNSPEQDRITGDQMELKFKASICDEQEVSTRNVDPDGWGLQTLWLFCFDKDGAFIGRSQASLGREPITSAERTFSAIVSSRTRIVHLLANQVLDGVFNDNDNLGAHEKTVMTGLESTSSSMVYWGRVNHADLESAETFQTTFGNEVIPMWRNHAAITYDSENLPEILQVEGFAICNYYANGTSVPFNSASNKFDWEANWIDNPFITTPLNHTKASDSEDIDTEKTTYIYETNNQGEDELYLIFKLNINGNTGYYKVAMVDENKDPLPIYRNYKYTIKFDKNRAPTIAASPDFESAKKAAPINNTWVAVSAEIPSIGNNEQGILSIVGETTKIYETGGEKTLEYTYTGKETPVVSWITDDGVAVSENLKHQFSGGKGTVTFTANQMKEGEVHRGTLRVKAGPLVRYIKIVTVKKFEFTPVWCSSGVEGSKANEDVALTFVVPETYPQELLPLRCLISTSELSGNGAVKLDVIYADDPDYGEANGLGYKYLYLAETVGQHRIYFQTNYSANQPAGIIKLEAEHFKSVEKRYDFSQDNKDLQLELTGEYVSKFDAKNWGSTNASSFIYYQLVPRKKGALVKFDLRYTENNDLNNLQVLPAGINIAIYTSNLEPVDKSLFKREESSYGSGPFWYYTTQAGSDEIAFRTLKANSEEAIRFVSITNQGTGEYRSCIMELANYHEWYFNQDNLLSITSPCDYGKERDVQISFSVKEFLSNHQDPAIPNILVYPGDGFKVYIDTENLTLGDNPTKKGVIEKTPTGYSYTVANEDKENGKITLNFKTNKIVSAETVTLRSDETTSFIPVDLKITNSPLTGSITYNNALLPSNAFVTIERKDGTRIGRVTLTDGGTRYSILLRGEFNFNWDDEIYMTYKASDRIFQASTTLDYLYNNKVINLQEIQ